MARKLEKPIDLAQLKTLMRLKPSLDDTAAFFECDPSTIERTIKREFGGIRFADFREQNMVQTRFSLIRKALQKANNGDNVMLIFCLKNLCGWKDRHEVAGTQEEKAKPIAIAYLPKSEREGIS